MFATAWLAAAACGDSKPDWQWPEATPEELGMDSAVLAGARDYAFQDAKHTQGVVVTRRGVLVANLTNGDARRYSPIALPAEALGVLKKGANVLAVTMQSPGRAKVDVALEVVVGCGGLGGSGVR